MKTRLEQSQYWLALAGYWLAITLLIALTAIIVWKVLFLSPCALSKKTCSIDSSSLAGLAATVLAVAATILGILGAVAVAAWWTNLDRRVDMRVNDLVGEIIYDFLLTDYEKNHLRYFGENQDFMATDLEEFRVELRHLLALKLIDRDERGGFSRLFPDFHRYGAVNIKDYFHISQKGRDYLDRMDRLEQQLQ